MDDIRITWDLCTPTKLHCVIFQETTIVLGATMRNFMVKEIEATYYRLSLTTTWELSTHFFQSLNCDTFVLGLFIHSYNTCILNSRKNCTFGWVRMIALSLPAKLYFIRVTDYNTAIVCPLCTEQPNVHCCHFALLSYHIFEFYCHMSLYLKHKSSILVNNQLDAQFFFHIYLFQFCTCFEHPCAHHQENQSY